MRSVLCRFTQEFLVLVLCVLAAGCTSNASTESSEEAADSPSGDAIALSWRAALLDGDVNAALELVADEFISDQWRTRRDLADYLHTAHSRGYFEHGVPLEVAAGATDSSTPPNHYRTAFRSAMGTAVWEITVNDTAEISSARLEIY